MAFTVTKVDVWSTEISDEPGELAAKLEGLAGAGANLDFLIARRQPEKVGVGIVFVTGIKGPAAHRAAKVAGLAKTTALAALRVDASNKSGVCHQMLNQIASAGINVRGVSASAIGSKCVTLVAFDSKDDANKAARLLGKAGRK